MPINLTCLCGRQQSVAKAMAGQTLVCIDCGRPLPIPSLEVLRRRKAKARSTEGPPDEGDFAPTFGGRRVLAAAMAGLLLLIGAVGLVAWLATNRPQPQPDQVAQADSPRKSPPPASQGLHRQLVPDEPKLTEPTKPELLRVPSSKDPREMPPPTSLVKPITIVDPGVRTEPVKPLVPLVKPKEKDPPAMEIMDPTRGPRLVWTLKEGEAFYQEVIVTQEPNFRVQGLPVQLFLKYRVVSRFTVEKSNEDGSWVAQQKIETVKLLQADDLTQAAVAGLVAQLPGTTFTLHLSPKMEVTQFQAGAQAKPGVVPLAGGQGLQLASLLDRDGWKELAQLTFFHMDQPPKPKTRWTKPLTHQWGALGSWAGQVQYEYQGHQGDIHKVGYALQLKYKAPAKEAVLAGMQISGANFQPQQAGGLISFDAVRGKVVVAEERFRVKGVLNAMLLGQPTPIELDEDQHFLIRIHEKKPD
jgi:hypothetical protein